MTTRAAAGREHDDRQLVPGNAMSATAQPPDRPVARSWWTVLLLTLLTIVLAGAASAAGRPEARLRHFWEGWLDDTGVLMSANERRVFLELDTDRRREQFLWAFWEARGDQALERWRRNLESARQLRSVAAERTRLVLLTGKPDRIDSFQGCNDRMRPFEVWRWNRWQLARQGGDPDGGDPDSGDPDSGDAVAVLVQTAAFDPRSFQLWDPDEAAQLGFGPQAPADLDELLAAADLERCAGPTRARRLRVDLRRALTESELAARAPWTVPDEAWLTAFADSVRGSLGSLSGGSLSGARLEISFPGRFGEQTILRGTVTTPAAGARARLHTLAPGLVFDRVTIRGDLYRAGRLVDSFENVHHLAGAVTGELVDLHFYRRLRPGDYELDVRVADRADRALIRERRQFSAPSLTEEAPAPAGIAGGFSQLTRSEVVVLDTFPGVELLSLAASKLSRVRVRAATTGGPIAAVEFLLDGRSLEIDRSPPFAVELERPSQRARLEAVAFDPQNRELGRDARWLDPEARPLSVRAMTPEPGAATVAVRVTSPPGEEVTRLECFHRRRSISVATEAPYSCPLPSRSGPGLDYLRIEATLTNGERAEDVLVLGPEPEQIDVQLAEIYVAVVDRRGAPITDLERADFKVIENGSVRPLERTEALSDLPLDVALLMDISSSMGRRVRTAVASAQSFFESVIGPGDEASLVAFNHDLHLLAPFTDDVRELGHSAKGQRAWGSTRLYDAVVYALFQFAGRGHRRALIVLTDGADTESDHRFEQVLDAAVRAGVALYPIALGSVDDETRRHLEVLARDTGGQSFAARDVGDLDSVYRRIEHALRSQYLLVYHPDASRPDASRSEEGALDGSLAVEVLRPGSTIRGLRGRRPTAETSRP